MKIGQAINLKPGPATRDAFGEALLELGRSNKKIVVVDGDVGNSTRTQAFGEEFPERFFNLGIAESNMVSVASGLAAAGKDALVSSFAAFLLCNAYDQIRMGVAFPRLNVKLVGSHSGISIGEDGPSQMGIEDIALATSLPNMTVLVPADAPATAAATRALFAHDGPVYLRTGRPKVPIIYGDDAEFQIGRANQLRQGKDVTIIACGLMVAAALEAAHELSQQQIEASVLDMHTIKPLDHAAIAEAARTTGALVTAEEHLLQGGLGAAVAQSVAVQLPVPIESVGIAGHYAESGTADELLQKYGLMPSDIVQAVHRVLRRKDRSGTQIQSAPN